MVHVYVLCDPMTDEVRYVGITSRPKMRLWHHVNGRASTRCKRWIRGLKERGREPKMQVLLSVGSRALAYDVEKLVIAKFKAAGARLTNVSEGGFYIPGRIRRRLAKQGRTYSRAR